MKTSLYLFFDVSGSMNELGKIHIQRNLCRYVAQLQLIDQEKYANIDIRFYQWAQDISEIAVQSDGSITTLNTQGSSSLNILSDFLFQNLNSTERSKILILSDGNFSNSNILSFHSQLSSISDLIIRTVAVGADADLIKLKKFSTNNSVYLSEDITSAFDCIFFESDEQLAVPISTDQILKSEPAESAELEEDWDV